MSEETESVLDNESVPSKNSYNKNYILFYCTYCNVLVIFFMYSLIRQLRLPHTMNVRFSLLDIAQRILGVTLPNFQ